MRFFKISLITFCIAFCFFISNAVAADMAKIGMIDLQKILGTSNTAKAAQQKAAAKGKELQADLDTKAAALTEEQERYKREAAVMSSEARSEKERDLYMKDYDLEKLKAKYETDFNVYRQQTLNQLYADVFSVAAKIGEAEGYTLILERSSGGVVYAPSAIDITDKVIQQYDQAAAGN